MCGRYASSSRPEDLVEEFDVDEDRTGEVARSILVTPQNPPAGQPDFNIAPTKQAPVVLTRAVRGDADAAPVRQLRLLTWGLVPSWSKDVKLGLRMTNARSESLLDTSSFARAAAARRCLVPADGWYEWQLSPTAVDVKGKPRKQPFFIHRSDGAPLAMAGVYEFWRDTSLAEDDPYAWLTTYAIITTAAEPGLDRIHDRQPLVLERADWSDWLDPTQKDLSAIKTHLEFSRPGRFDAYPVGTAVNSTRNNGELLLLPSSRADLVGVVDPTTGEIIGE
ncbi:MAG TPA: SOS response-associated peptidase [Dermatophilaceae bacterium]|nr:SOS response-associated peptidase [Dermatophilaceae bacterium]